MLSARWMAGRCSLGGKAASSGGRLASSGCATSSPGRRACRPPMPARQPPAVWRCMQGRQVRDLRASPAVAGMSPGHRIRHNNPSSLTCRSFPPCWEVFWKFQPHGTRVHTADLSLKLKDVDLSSFTLLHEALGFPTRVRHHGPPWRSRLKWKLENDHCAFRTALRGGCGCSAGLEPGWSV